MLLKHEPTHTWVGRYKRVAGVNHLVLSCFLCLQFTSMASGDKASLIHRNGTLTGMLTKGFKHISDSGFLPEARPAVYRVLQGAGQAVQGFPRALLTARCFM